jgi:hypothetical protein
MSNTTTIYRSSDASAPTLTGAAGSLLGVLDACLVNGYGSQSAAGWTKPYSNSGNVGCYQNSSGVGTGSGLSVNDAGPGAGSYREARCTGFSSLTSVSAGTNQFPTSGQLGIGSGAVVCRKSATADSTQRVWTLIADDTVFYLFVETGDYTNPLIALPFMFGDIFSYATEASLTDTYRCMIVGRNNENSSYQGYDGFANFHGASTVFLSQTMIGHFLSGLSTGAGSQLFGKHTDHSKSGYFGGCGSPSGTSGNGAISTGSYQVIGCVYSGSGTSVSPSAMISPNAPDGAIYLSPLYIHHSSSVRGYFKGLWVPAQSLPMGHKGTYSGAGVMSGKTFESLWILGSTEIGAVPGEVHVETSSTWS